MLKSSSSNDRNNIKYFATLEITLKHLAFSLLFIIITLHLFSRVQPSIVISCSHVQSFPPFISMNTNNQVWPSTLLIHYKTDVTFTLLAAIRPYLIVKANKVNLHHNFGVTVQSGGMAAIGPGAQMNMTQADSEK